MNEKVKNNAGTTLVELMIYMIVALIVITAAFKVISHAASGYSHGRAVSKAQFSARDGLNIMARDIASMGYKMHFEAPNSVKPDSVILRIDTEFATTIHANVATNNRHKPAPEGNAAFLFVNGGADNSDNLEFFRIRVNEEGRREARERIVYSFDEDNKQIIREFSEWDDTPPPGNWRIENSTIIASNVVALNFRFSKKGDDVETNWHSDFNAIRRDEVRHVEIALLVESHRNSAGQYGAASYMVGDRKFENTNPNRVYRLYRQVIEVPNNARGNE